jgi:peptidoglycan/LPS O-acetylase OafA/YrhL
VRDAAAHPSRFRADIEGMRAIAVVLVLLYHAALGPFGGGYVGVDVFFVVSGFLITGVLLRDFGDGVRSLPGFWARRARRLLLASVLVIVATIVAGRFVLDPLAQRSLARDAIAAGVFVVNIVFARRAGDYFASQLAPSPLLHFWSLAVEEQFYLLWPLLLLAFRRLRRRRTAVLLTAIGSLWVASFVASIVVTEHHGPWAFYLLPTRAWELLSGAAVAIVGHRVAAWIPSTWRAALGWLGVGAVCSAALLLGGRQDFPGWIALWPVAGTVAMVLGGISAASHGPQRLLSSAPLVWIGRRSYGIYLWHWPALVLVAAAAGPLVAWQRGAVVCGSVVIAALTYQVLENPVRHSTWLALRPRRSLMLGAGLIACALATAAVSIGIPQRLDSGRIAAPAAIVVPTTPKNPTATPTPTPTASPTTSPVTTSTPVPSSAGPELSPDPATSPTVAATTLPAATATVADIVAANNVTLTQSVLIHDVPANLRPTLSAAAADKPSIYHDGCMLSDGQSTPQPCVYGDPAWATEVVLFGDSHAAQWFPALQQIAAAHHWRLEVLTKKGCPTADIRIAKRQLDGECIRWRATVAQRLSVEHPALIVMSAYRYDLAGSERNLDPDTAWRAGLDATLQALRPSAGKVLVLGDTPTPASNAPACIAAHLRAVDRCVATRARAVKPLRLAVEQDEARIHDAAFATTSDWLCTPTTCPVILGDVLLYRDNSHLTTTASLLLAPYLDATLTPLLGNTS